MISFVQIPNMSTSSTTVCNLLIQKSIKSATRVKIRIFSHNCINAKVEKSILVRAQAPIQALGSCYKAMQHLILLCSSELMTWTNFKWNVAQTYE